MSIDAGLLEHARTISEDRPAPTRLPALKLMALGMLVLQLAWVFAVPPFRGSDEFDHVYKAAAVARGQWFVTPTDATRGTGAWLEVPVDIVKAAQPECMPLPYTGVADCIGQWHGDVARIASGAGRYHPFFYAIVGAPALPFSGDAALYVMRLMTALMSWGLFCLALAATRTWARSAWPFVGVAVASTPVLVYSTSIVAPNGVEMMAALGLWTALIGLLLDGQPHRDTLLTVVAGVSGSLLATLRSMGPLWCLLIAGTVLLAAPPSLERLRQLLRSKRAQLASGIVLLSALQSTWWVLAMKSLDLGGGEAPPAASTLAKVTYATRQALIWLFQSIAAFPSRNEPTKPVVYAGFLLFFVALLGLALWTSGPRVRIALCVATLVPVALPFAITVVRFDSDAGLWQGRYGLPYAIGIVVLAGLALEFRRLRLPSGVALGGLTLFVVGESVAPVDVMLRELGSSPLSGTSAWLHPSVFIVALLAGLGSTLLWLGASSADTTQRGQGFARDSVTGTTPPVEAVLERMELLPRYARPEPGST